jgi:hypothetical protein
MYIEPEFIMGVSLGFEFLPAEGEFGDMFVIDLLILRLIIHRL